MAILVSTDQNPKYGTGVDKLAIANAGTGYTAYDVLTINSGDTNALIEVQTVGGAGEILTFDRVEIGSGYSAGTYGVTGGTGASAQFTITVKQGIGVKNGFYKAEEYNLGGSSSGGATLGLTAWNTQALTFQRASNISGVQLFLLTGKSLTDVKYYPTAVSIQKAETCTMTIASPCVVTLTGHGLVANDALGFTTTGALPTGVTATTVYFVHTVLTPDTFTIKTTLTGNQVNTSGSQSGTHTIWADRTVCIKSGDEMLYSGYFAYHAPKYTFKFATPLATDTTANKWRLAMRSHNDGLFTYGNSATVYNSITNGLGVYRIIYGDNQTSYKDSEKAVYFSNGSPCIATAHNHELVADQPIRFFQTDGSSPVTLTSVYYVLATGLTKSKFQFSTSVGGAAVNTVSAHTGVCRMFTQSCTISIASPAVVTRVGHGLEVGDVVRFNTTGALPTGITGETPASAVTGGTNYYITSVPSADTFQFSTSLGGTPINTSGSQSGVHFLIYSNPMVAVDETHIDQDCYFGGIQSTGDNNIDAVVIGASGIDNENGGSLLKWENNPLKSYRFSTAGCIGVGATSNMEVGRRLKNTTITIASPAVLTYANHGLEEGQLVSFTRNETETTTTLTEYNIRTEELPTGLSFDKHYYVKLIDANTFKLSETVGGADINTSGTQTGTHHLNVPIPFAKQAIIYISLIPNQANLTSFGGMRAGYIVLSHAPSGHFMNGEYPEHCYTILASQVNALATTITTTDDMSSEWGIGDRIGIGKWDTPNAGRPPYTITNIAGTTITISPAVSAGYTALAGGHVVNISRRGIAMYPPFANLNVYWQHSGPNHLLTRGVYARYILFNGVSYDTNYDPTSIRTNVEFDHIGSDSGTGTTSSIILQGYVPHPVATYIHDNYTCQSATLYSFGQAPISSPANGITSTGRYISMKRNIITNTYNSELHNNTALNFLQTFDIQDNICENKYYSTLFAYGLYGINCIFKNNTFWGIGGSSVYGAVHVGQLINPIKIADNKFDRCTYAYNYMPFITKNVKIENDIIGTESAITAYNTTTSGADAIIDIQIENPNVDAVIPSSQMLTAIDTSEVRVVNNIDATGQDYVSQKYGQLARTGTSLIDTTAHNSGYAMRFESTSSTNRLEWKLNGGNGFTTGNCQNKELTFIIWVKLNNANYWAGTHEMPRVDINYDNGTHVYGYAGQTTEWQRVPISFTPATTFGTIYVSVTTMTDETSTDAYVYFDDYSVQLPQGVQVIPGTMDFWANAKPADGLATNLNSKDVADAVWDDKLVEHTVSGSFSEKITKLKNPSYIVGKAIV